MKKEKISCIVTVYNRFEYVRNIIISLKRQSLQIDELILTDDGSKGDLFEVIKDLLDDCKFKIKYVFQEDLAFRAARSRNNGVREAEGDFLIFLDQDLILPEDFIEKVYLARKKERMLISIGVFSEEQEKEKIQELLSQEYNYKKFTDFISLDKLESIRKREKKNRLYNLLYKLKLRTRGTKMASYFFALHKEDFIKLNGFDEKYIGYGEEDDDLSNRFYKMGGLIDIVVLKYPLIHMYHHSVPSKKEGPNLKYYRQRKKEISKNNYRTEYGFDNTLGKDKYIVKILN
ncbi:MAG: glycosyl transferase [Fusobacteriales bacterium]|nr:MAG: glycosyl transferase [Fusobacteriales bacterium]